MKQKGFVQILLVLVLLALVGGVAYYFGKKGNILPNPTQTASPVAINTPTANMPSTKPTSDPTASWKTYTNTKYGYSLKYPDSWVPSRGPGNLTDEQISKQRDVELDDPNLPGEDPGTGFYVTTNELDATGDSRKCTTLDDCFSKTFSWLLQHTKIDKTATTFLGQPAIQFTYQRDTALYSQTWKYIYFIYKENAHNIHISTATSRTKIIFDTFDKILSTFKFTR